jgi:hypothetical protein
MISSPGSFHDHLNGSRVIASSKFYALVAIALLHIVMDMQRCARLGSGRKPDRSRPAPRERPRLE